MSQKPGDLMLGVIEFFGILIPGAALAFLHSDLFLEPFGASIKCKDALDLSVDWFVFFVLSLVLGYVLHILGDLLDLIAGQILSICRRIRPNKYMELARAELESGLPIGVGPNVRPEFLYYAAFSFLRVNSTEAVTDLERHAAKFKLFRGMAWLFIWDIVISMFFRSCSPTRLMASLVGLLVSLALFFRLFVWTYALAFDLYLQVRELSAKEK